MIMLAEAAAWIATFCIVPELKFNGNPVGSNIENVLQAGKPQPVCAQSISAGGAPRLPP